MSPQALFETMLAFHRAPAAFPELRNPAVPLKGDLGLVLRLANGTRAASLGVSDSSAPDDLVREAAVFFIQQVLLLPGADHYRLHGLSRDAGEEEIKEHYRLLMRLLHPDRQTLDQDWQFAATVRVNQADAVLRDPDRRREYDLTLPPPAGPGLTPPRPGRHLARMPERRADTPLQRFLWRRLPQLIMLGILFLVSLPLGWMWWHRSPAGAPGGDQESGRVVRVAGPGPASTEVGGSAAVFNPPANGQQPESPVGQAVEGPAAGLPASAPDTSVRVPVGAADPVARVGPPTVHPQGAGPAEAATATLGAKTFSGRPGERLARRQAVRVASEPAPAQTGFASAVPAQTQEGGGPDVPRDDRGVGEPPVRPSSPGMDGPAIPTATAVVRHLPAAPPEPPPAVRATPAVPFEPAVMARRYAEGYAQGSIRPFMDLFDKDARTESGGLAAIWRDYETLFNETQTRRIDFRGWVWERAGDMWRGDGVFIATVQRRGESVQRQYTGTVRMLVAERGGAPRIAAFYHKATEQAGD